MRQGALGAAFGIVQSAVPLHPALDRQALEKIPRGQGDFRGDRRTPERVKRRAVGIPLRPAGGRRAQSAPAPRGEKNRGRSFRARTRSRSTRWSQSTGAEASAERPRPAWHSPLRRTAVELARVFPSMAGGRPDARARRSGVPQNGKAPQKLPDGRRAKGGQRVKQRRREIPKRRRRRRRSGLPPGSPRPAVRAVRCRAAGLRAVSCKAAGIRRCASFGQNGRRDQQTTRCGLRLRAQIASRPVVLRVRGTVARTKAGLRIGSGKYRRARKRSRTTRTITGSRT